MEQSIKLSRVDFLNKVENKEFKNGTEFEVIKGENVIGIIAVQRTIVVYVDVPKDIFDLLTNDDYEFMQIAEETVAPEQTVEEE